ncbi:MAG: hypothetical protein KKD28_04400 [Chloroflexi bacterium]|nr:hypothetical protein [Chloroflexota bacterium]
MPFRASLVRQIVNDIQANSDRIVSSRPASGSKEERDFVHYLHLECGTSLQRIARLLDGNDIVNLQRIQAYEYK